jgi:hypothetical protein
MVFFRSRIPPAAFTQIIADSSDESGKHSYLYGIKPIGQNIGYYGCRYRAASWRDTVKNRPYFFPTVLVGIHRNHLKLII